MSGLSLGATPRSDPIAPDPSPAAKNRSVMGGLLGSLRVIELQLVAFIMVFSVSGLVPLLDIVFPVFCTIYTVILSRVFPLRKNSSTQSREIFNASTLFRAYVLLGTTVGLFLPLAYVLGGFARGDDHAVRSATPHLFLLSCQILSENAISSLSLFSPPIRAILPMLYTVRRIFLIVDWNYDVWLYKSVPTGVSIENLTWHWFGRGLATANLVYFSVNLFGFLIPRFLPLAFERYIKESDDLYTKMAEDKAAPDGPAEEQKLDKLKKAD